jgi:hypothetical protein
MGGLGGKSCGGNLALWGRLAKLTTHVSLALQTRRASECVRHPELSDSLASASCL